VDIKRSASQTSSKAPADHFTGEVHMQTMNEAPAPTRASIISVTFQPGARSAWHSHPLGQTLIVTDGRGRVQSWEGPVEEIESGDVVWTPPSEKHWHGASDTAAMTHISIVEQLDGKVVDWMERVSDEQYQAGSKKD
jgi:quercetin dioxygenase-like cupin family protein